MIDTSGGRKFSGEIVGDLQVISNIEAPRTTRLFELWYDHTFLENKLSILVGLHDYNSEFDVTQYGGLFINSSFGIGPDISSSARPSIFPLSAPALRVKITPSEEWEFLFGVYDGDPGDPDTSEHFPRSDYDADGGAFLASEAAYHFAPDSLPGSIKLGVWHNTGEFDDVVAVDRNGDPIKRDGNTGGYLVVDKMLYREKDEQGLGSFFQFGSNRKNVNTVHTYVGGGLTYLGFIPNRDQDEIGIALAHALITDDLVDAGGWEDFETTIEATYKAQITQFLSIQPDIQFVFNPGALEDMKDAFVAGARVETVF